MVLAFLLSLNGAAYFGTLAIWAEETGYERSIPSGTEYRDTEEFKQELVLRIRYPLQSLCENEVRLQELTNREMTLQEYKLAEDGAASTSILTGNTTMRWDEYLELPDNGKRISVKLEEGQRENSVVLCAGGAMFVESWYDENVYIKLSVDDFLSLFDAYPGEIVWPEQDWYEKNQAIIEETADDEATRGAVLEDYCWNCIDANSEDYYEFSADVRLYENGDDFLLYDRGNGTFQGSRMQKVRVADLEKAEYVYFAVPERFEEGVSSQWLDNIVMGFTTSLSGQVAYEVEKSNHNYKNDVLSDEVTYWAIYRDGKLFMEESYDKKNDNDIQLAFETQEEKEKVFDADSEVCKEEYTVYVTFNESEVTHSAWYAVSEFLYSGCQSFGVPTGAAVMLALFALIFGILVLVSFLPPLWFREEKKKRDACPMEILLLLGFAVFCGIAGVYAGITESRFMLKLLQYFHTGWMLIGGAAVIEIPAVIGLMAVYYLVSTTVYRLRHHCFFKGFLLGRVCLWFGRKIKRAGEKVLQKCKVIVQNMDILKRRIMVLAAVWIPSLIIMAIVTALMNDYGFGFSEFVMFCYLVFMVGFSFSVIKSALDNKRLLDGCNRMKEGRLGEKISTEKLYYGKLELANAINTMGEGLEKAVKTSMKDERMKTELITNVSHDIKTPLTSIINYVDLLKRENNTPEEQQEYLKVLDAKSQRLKQLIEDLVEVSKTSTGNVELQMAQLDFLELFNQALVEFQEKFEERRLEMIVSHEEHKIQIWADGRRCYRILENLFQNIYKYAMPGTRVYADLKQEENQLVFTMKNISEAPLNIPVEELMERFVRGDVSRSTSGSGLGLSIAQNLVTLQQGTFKIMLDGDLFKVEIRFPVLASD